MGLIIPITLLAILVGLYISFLKWRHNYWARQGAPQMPTDLLFGNFTPLATGKQSSFDFFKDLYFYGKKKGLKYLGVYSLWKPEVVIIDKELIKTILTKDFEYFGSHGTYRHKNEPLTIHLFNLEGQDWKDRRVKMTPLFTTGKLKGMFSTLTEKSNVLSNYLGSYADEKKPLNLKDTFARYTTDNITNVAFGLDTNSFAEKNSFFKQLGDKLVVPSLVFTLLSIVFSDKMLGDFGFKVHDKEITETFVNTINDIVKMRENSKGKRNDFMELMLQLKKYGTVNDKETGSNAKTYMTDDEIRSESFLFFFAGFDTSSSTTTFAVWELARHPEIQEKVRNEINRVLEKHNGELTYDALAEMTYLDMVIRETLRLYPIVTVLPRMCTKDYKIPGTEVIIKKGSKVFVPLNGLQRDPDYYENPDEFNPENMSSEKEADFTWLPFGYGPRQCIGMRLGLLQSKLGVLAAIKNFKFTLHESMKPPYTFRPGSLLLYLKNDPIVNITRV